MISDYVGTIGGAVGLVVFLGAAVIYLRGSKDKGTIATLSQSNDALIERVALLEDSEKRLKAEATAMKVLHAAEIKALDTRLGVCELENEALRAQRPSADVLTDLMAMQQILHEQTTALADRLELHDKRVAEVAAKITGEGKP
jgi:hypothetical protein